MKALTERQKEILEFHQRFTRNHGHPPTVRDICQGMGMTSTATVQKHIQSLRRKGVFSQANGKTRATVLVMPPSGTEQPTPARHMLTCPYCAREFLPPHALAASSTGTNEGEPLG